MIFPELRECGRKGKAELLKELRFPRDITWEEAHEKLKHYIVCARRVGDDAKAAQLSEANSFLKTRLKHRCATCPKVIHPRSTICQSCANRRRHGVAKAYRTYAGHYGIPPFVEAFVRARSTAFFLDEVIYAVHERLPGVPRAVVAKSAYAALKYMRKRGIVTGGGLAHWRRYVPTRLAPQPQPCSAAPLSSHAFPLLVPPCSTAAFPPEVPSPDKQRAASPAPRCVLPADAGAAP